MLLRKNSFLSVIILFVHIFTTADLLENLPSCRDSDPSDCFVIFIHAQQSGLYRIHLQGPPSRYWVNVYFYFSYYFIANLTFLRINFATPLVDGIVVSRRALGTLVRQTAINMGKRRRLDHDRYFVIFPLLISLLIISSCSYQLPHIRRKLKVSEMASKYRSDLDTPSFFSSLFHSPELGLWQIIV